MKFVDSNLENVLSILDKLDASKKPSWGTMNAQQMVEHLSKTLDVAMGKGEYEIQVNPEQYEAMKKFILSDKSLPKDFKAVFAPENPALEFEELELAIDDYCDKWIDLEMFFSMNEGIETMHPHFGPLNFELWKRLHEKHLTHHFLQFGLIEEE